MIWVSRIDLLKSLKVLVKLSGSIY